MLGATLIAVGAIAMIFGTWMLWQWNSGQSRWTDSGATDRTGQSKNDRQFLALYFLALVIAPLLSGATLILLGLNRVLSRHSGDWPFGR